MQTTLRNKIYRYIRGRSDAWTLMQTTPDPKYLTVRKGLLTWADYKKHFEGEQTIALYPVTNQEFVTFICFDVDVADKENIHRLIKGVRAFVDDDNFIIESAGGGGYHLYIAFDRPTFAVSARALGFLILAHCFPLAQSDYDLRAASRTAKIELFPKQDRTHSEKTLGNAIRIPLGYHRIKEKWARLINPDTLFVIRKEQEDTTTWEPISGDRAEQIVDEHSDRLTELNTRPQIDAGYNYAKDRPCFDQIIAAGVDEGERALCGFHYASYLFYAHKLDHNGVYDKLSEWNNKNKPPLNERKLLECLDRGRSYIPPACNHPFLLDYCHLAGDCSKKPKT